MSKVQWSKWESSSSVKAVDLLDRCKLNVRSIEDLADDGKLLNKKQCQDLSSKLSETTLNIRKLVLRCGAPGDLFRPALENLDRSLEKAKELVSNCGEDQWWVASLFQSQNENAFRETLLEVRSCYDAIYELAKSSGEDWKDLPQDLRQSGVFVPATDNDVHKDQLDLEKRFGDFANVDFLNLCKESVSGIKDLVNGVNLLNRRQCLDLSTKLSKTTLNIFELLLRCGASAAVHFHLALKNLYRYLEKAKVLVSTCAEKDWLAAAVFQVQNESAFREILLDVSLCYNAIYEQAQIASKKWNSQLEDLRQTSVFLPAIDSDVTGDKMDLQKKLDELASGHTTFKGLGYWIPGRVARKQSLAKYLLMKMHCTSLQPQANTLDTYSAMLWTKASEPSGTWGTSWLLGAGSGAGGVFSTSWLGIPCAKKEFHGQEYESSFMKEAGILAQLKHPCIVNFICCGNDRERGDRFIATELMEMSLFHLIEVQKYKGVYFPLPIAIDIIVQMARGMCYLHDQGVAHGDLKPQNVVVNRLTSPHLEDHYCVKLVDFGVSKVSKSKFVSYQGIGTTMYRAPEAHPRAYLFSGGKVNWFKADAFSFATTCAHLLSLNIPFEEFKRSEFYNEVFWNARRPELPDMCPQDLVVLLKDCWKNNSLSRPSFVQICTRLEIFRQKMLRGDSILHQGLPKDHMDSSLSFALMKMKLAGQSSNSQTILPEVKITCAQCDAVAKVYHAGVERISTLVLVVPFLLEAASSSEQRIAAWDSQSLLLYSLAEIQRCIRSGTIYISNCAIDPEVVSTDHPDACCLSKMACFLLRDFSFCLDLVKVAFNRFMLELFSFNALALPESAVVPKLGRYIAEEFCAFNLFEWCERSCRPILIERFVELGQEVLEHPSVAKGWVRRLMKDLASPWTEVLEEPSGKPSDLMPEIIDYKDIREGAFLGQGGFGTVLECKWRNQDMVVKIVELNPNCPDYEDKLKMEVSILSSIRHLNAVQIFGYGYRKGKTQGFILMERMEMDLSKLIHNQLETMKVLNPPLFPRNITLDMLFQIVEGMCYLKEKGVIHRDIKPNNILVNRPFGHHYHLKLADFGTSKVNEVDSIFNTVRTGTPAYMAPEVNVEGTGNQGYSFKADVYSFGMVCSEILTGKRPFLHLNGHLRNTRKALHGGERPDLPLDCGDPLRKLVEDCWELKPEERPNIWQVRQRLWECRVHCFFRMERPPMSVQDFRTDLESQFDAIKKCQSEMGGLPDIIEDDDDDDEEE